MNSQKREPFLLTPVGKNYVWGGSRLNDDFSLSLPCSPLAEAWVCSTHPDGQSIISTGIYRGITLGAVLDAHPELLGQHASMAMSGKLPVLIKLIDARANLSVQVHPDDAYALQNEKDNGKTEMWYILDAKKDTSLVYGFNRDTSESEIRDAVCSGSIESLLNHVPVQKNDVLFIPAGIVHALGAGALIAEVHENSNVTYRIWDYGRDRPLHLEKALSVANLHSSASPRQPMRTLRYKPGFASELLCRCKYFQVERLLLNTENRQLPEYSTGENSFHALLITDGCGMMLGEGVNLPFFKGDCVFVPASSALLRLHGRAQMLDVSC